MEGRQEKMPQKNPSPGRSDSGSGRDPNAQRGPAHTPTSSLERTSIPPTVTQLVSTRAGTGAQPPGLGSFADCFSPFLWFLFLLLPNPRGGEIGMGIFPRAFPFGKGWVDG